MGKLQGSGKEKQFTACTNQCGWSAAGEDLGCFRAVPVDAGNLRWRFHFLKAPASVGLLRFSWKIFPGKLKRTVYSTGNL